MGGGGGPIPPAFFSPSPLSDKRELKTKRELGSERTEYESVRKVLDSSGGYAR